MPLLLLIGLSNDGEEMRDERWWLEDEDNEDDRGLLLWESDTVIFADGREGDEVWGTGENNRLRNGTFCIDTCCAYEWSLLEIWLLPGVTSTNSSSGELLDVVFLLFVPGGEGATEVIVRLVNICCYNWFNIQNKKEIVDGVAKLWLK